MATPTVTDILEAQPSQPRNGKRRARASRLSRTSQAPLAMPEISSEVAAFLEGHPGVQAYLPGAVAATERWFPGSVLRLELEKSEVTGEPVSLLIVCESKFDVGASLEAREQLLRAFWIPLPREVWSVLDFHLEFAAAESIESSLPQ